MNEPQPLSGQKHEVRVHIDQEPFTSPNPTTGVALYTLGGVAETVVPLLSLAILEAAR